MRIIFGSAFVIVLAGSVAIWMLSRDNRKDTDSPSLPSNTSDFSANFDSIEINQKDFVKLLDSMHDHIVGMDDLLLSLSIALLVQGHVLVEGLPGLAKTKTIAIFSQMLGLDFTRMQFTPDMLPADITGTEIYNDRTKSFETRYGPIVTNIFLADEINRTSPKVQSALLESMQEQQITIGGVTKKLPYPFLVLATQNPIEQEGTYILPEAQVDRFLCKVVVDYPTAEQEADILDLIHDTKKIRGSLSISKISAFQKEVENIVVSDSLKKYMISLVQATRVSHPNILYGASPRGSISVYHMSQALAWLQGRGHVEKKDVCTVLLPALRHRIVLSYAAQSKNINADDVLRSILSGL